MSRVLSVVLVTAATLPAAASSPPFTWSEQASAAATGYCLAHHPYRTLEPGPFTAAGFELVAPPGVVGAVRRNFIAQRSSKLDEGSLNTCADACREFGKLYGPESPYVGVPLYQQVPDSKGGITLMASGLGDLAALAIRDYDFYLETEVVAGFASRGNTWHESDVAQADYCCCQLVDGR